MTVTELPRRIHRGPRAARPSTSTSWWWAPASPASTPRYHLRDASPTAPSSSWRRRTTAAAPGGPTGTRVCAPTATCSPTATGSSPGAGPRSRRAGRSSTTSTRSSRRTTWQPHIRYQHQVTAASWSSEERRWTVEVTRADTGEQLRFTTDFLWMCQGYYNHAKPYQPQWEGMDRFQGLVVHPQQWPEDLDLQRQARRRHRVGLHGLDADPRDRGDRRRT